MLRLSTKVVKDIIPKLMDGSGSLDQVVSSMEGSNINSNELQDIVNQVLQAILMLLKKLRMES